MTDRAQFEAMLNALINEDQEAAKEIFHNIVVAKSREIYEELLAEDFSEEEEEGVEEEFEPKKPKDTGNPYEEEEGEEEEEGAGEEEEGAGEEEEGESEANPFGGQEGEGEEEVGGEEGEGDIEDRVMDLEDALEDLKAEFEHLLAGEEHEEEQNPGIHGGELDGMMGGEEEVDEFAGLMEYTIKVPTAKMGDNGVNTKSAVAGKNDMGGTTANIAKGGTSTTGGTKGGLLNPSTKEENFGNVNVPGGNAGKTAFKKREPGHGAEKAGAKETADNKNSMLNGAPKRAK